MTNTVDSEVRGVVGRCYAGRRIIIPDNPECGTLYMGPVALASFGRLRSLLSRRSWYGNDNDRFDGIEEENIQAQHSVKSLTPARRSKPKGAGLVTGILSEQ